jgi:putative tryptophan/tyrosine transport system substrate-binding protein
VRYGETLNDRLPALARELVALSPDVLIATAAPAQIFLYEATKTTPIVFNFGGDPVPLGLAASHNRPGGNVTGVMGNLLDGFMPKRLQLAHELLPNAKRVGMPFNGSNLGHVPYRQAAEQAGATLNLDLLFAEVRSPVDFDAAFAQLKAQGAEVVLPDLLHALGPNRRTLVRRWTALDQLFP